QGFGLVAGEICGSRGRVAVVRRSRAHSSEIGAALAVRREIALPGVAILTGQLGESGEVGAKSFELGIDYRVGTISRDDPPAPFAFADSAMVIERVERAFGRRDDFDAEPVEQRA